MNVYDAEGNPIDTSPRPLAWVDFEDEVATWIEHHFESWCGLHRETASIKRRPRYFSARRQADIEFDISIEVCPPGARPQTPLLLWLVECKDYPSRPVTVDEIEEFRNKMEQVGAHKGTVVTRFGFQKSAIELAKSYRIGLMTLEKREVFVIQFSQDSGTCFHKEIHATLCLYPDGQIGEGNVSEFIKYQISQYLESTDVGRPPDA